MKQLLSFLFDAHVFQSRKDFLYRIAAATPIHSYRVIKHDYAHANQTAFDWTPSDKETGKSSFPNVTILFGDVLAEKHAMRVLAKIGCNPTESIDFRPQL